MTIENNKETIEITNGHIKPEDVFKILCNDFRYIARTKRGVWLRFLSKPVYDTLSGTWEVPGREGYSLYGLRIKFIGDWRNSLHKRPSSKQQKRRTQNEPTQ